MREIFFLTVSSRDAIDIELNLFPALYSVSYDLLPQIFPRTLTLFLKTVLALEKSTYQSVSLHANPEKLREPGM